MISAVDVQVIIHASPQNDKVAKNQVGKMMLASSISK